MKSLLVIASICVAAVLFVLLNNHSNLEPRSVSATNYNLIFITIDTLRADHTPFGNYHRNTMPATADFFHDGLNFTDAQTVRSTTAPSYAAMLSGLYPYRSGVRNNFAQLNDRVDTLTEKLRRVGYMTAAFVSSFVMVGRISGFNQGFDLYDDFVLEKELTRDNYERTAANTVSHALKWLEKVPRDQRFFLFLHFIDPHGPYHPPAPYDKSFKSTDSRMLSKNMIPGNQFISPVLDQYQYMDWYDGEILYLDSQLRALYEKLKDFENNTWFLFVADHGESMGERNLFFEHGDTVYAFQSRIPMVWLPPVPLRNKYKAAKIPHAVSLVDITPTSLEALKIRNVEESDGESLFPAFRGGNLKNPYRFIERYWGDDLCFAVRDSKFKMIQNYHAVPNQSWPSKIWRDTVWGEQSVEFFNLSSDPLEQRNTENVTAVPAEMKLALQKFITEARSYRPPYIVKKFKIPDNEMAEYVHDHAQDQVTTLTEEEAEKLKALGYAQ
jgi:arylsulfatase A-like enzyme